MLTNKIAQIKDWEIWTLADELPCSAWTKNGTPCSNPTLIAKVAQRSDRTFLVLPYCLEHLSDEELKVLVEEVGV